MGRLSLRNHEKTKEETENGTGLLKLRRKNEKKKSSIVVAAAITFNQANINED